MTWGGERQARVQLERSFRSGAIERVSGEFGISRRENPHFDIVDRRAGFALRASNPRRHAGCASAAAAAATTSGSASVRDRGVAVRRRCDVRHAGRSGLPAQRHSRDVRHRSAELRRRHAPSAKGRCSRLRRSARTDGAGGSRPRHRQRYGVAAVRAPPARRRGQPARLRRRLQGRRQSCRRVGRAAHPGDIARCRLAALA